MIIQGDSVGSACINDGIFIVLCKNINLFKYGISFVDIINTGELVHITADGIRPGRIVFYHNIAGKNGFIINIVKIIRFVVYRWLNQCYRTGIPAWFSIISPGSDESPPCVKYSFGTV